MDKQPTTPPSDPPKLFEDLQEFLDEISTIQNQLTTPGILGKFPNEEQKKQFKQFRMEWKRLVNETRINIASVLVEQLEANEVELKAGMGSIDGQINKLDDTVGFLDLLGRVIEVLKRIIIL